MDNQIAGPSADERLIVDDIVLDPTRNAATENQNKLGMFLPHVVPGDLETI